MLMAYAFSSKCGQPRVTDPFVLHTASQRMGQQGKEAMLTRNRSAIAQQGFTLIEVMIVVVIVALLMAVALPAYRDQVRRSHRAAAQAQMLEIASVQQQFLLSNRAYMDKGMLAAAGYSLDPLVLPHYRYSLTLGSGPVPTYQLRFTPIGAQAGDGWLQLDDRGNYSSQYGNRWRR